MLPGKPLSCFALTWPTDLLCACANTQTQSPAEQTNPEFDRPVCSVILSKQEAFTQNFTLSLIQTFKAIKTLDVELSRERAQKSIKCRDYHK